MKITCLNMPHIVFSMPLLLMFAIYEHLPKPPDNALQVRQDTTILQLADPAIIFYQGVYYLYGTGGTPGEGFLVYTSSDLKNWKGPSGASNGYALLKGDSYGTAGFWAPQVFFHNNTFYMAYTANENIAIAQSKNPLGPFRQKDIRPISGKGKQIDPFVFFDKSGKIFLFHVRLSEGNKLFVAQLANDLSDIMPGSVQDCLEATTPWENTTHSKWPVTEGPTVLSHKGMYYLFYSANDFRSIDYAVGYATSKSPYGPWEKFPGNPVLSRFNTGIHGPGHGDFFTGKNGNLLYVYHTHASDTTVQPRSTALVGAAFVADGNRHDKMVFDAKNFEYLRLQRAFSKK